MDLAEVRSWRSVRHRPDLALAHGERLVAGGTWLFSEPQPDVTGLVDLTTLGWADVEPMPEGSGIRVGATCTVESLRTAPWPEEVGRLAQQCADALLMSFKVQHAATVGGNHCLALPAGATISFTAALAGEVVLWTPGGAERREPVSSFVRGPGQTSLRPGEVLRAVDLPASTLGARFAFRRVALTAYGRSSALVIARRDPDAVVLTVTAATPRPVVVVLPVGASERLVRSAVADIGDTPGWYSDAHGPADWRAAMTARLAVEAVQEVSS